MTTERAVVLLVAVSAGIALLVYGAIDAGWIATVQIVGGLQIVAAAAKHGAEK